MWFHGRRHFEKSCFHLVFWGLALCRTGRGLFYCRKIYLLFGVAKSKRRLIFVALLIKKGRKMNWKAQKTKGQAPANIEVVWKKENGFFVIVAMSVCPTFPGDMIEPRRAEIATLIEFAPKMRELLQDIASRRRGSKAENWDIERAAEVLLEKMKVAESKF